MSSERLEQALRNWQEKLAYYEYERSITASSEKKFELQQKIKECNREIKRIQRQLEKPPLLIQLKSKPNRNTSVSKTLFYEESPQTTIEGRSETQKIKETEQKMAQEIGLSVLLIVVGWFIAWLISEQSSNPHPFLTGGIGGLFSSIAVLLASQQAKPSGPAKQGAQILMFSLMGILVGTFIWWVTGTFAPKGKYIEDHIELIQAFV
ncbi:MAG: hypothetical protein F6K19_50645, partial [Cyanothece sp. SIO1E1]|nr:hypothetical protein [Cyanothece sp. SIO1E1]